jgi:hypothetical protein
MENSYRLKAEGFKLDDIAKRVAEVIDLPLEPVREKSRRPRLFRPAAFFATTPPGNWE